MTINITYQPGKGFFLGDTFFLWETDREKTRILLSDIRSDSVTGLRQYYNGDTSHNTIQRRDIYKNYKGQENFFFLNFDANDRLTELELHYGFDITVNGVVIDFLMDTEKLLIHLTVFLETKTNFLTGSIFSKT